MKKLALLFCLLASALFTEAADTLTIHDHESKFLTRRYFSELEDKQGTLVFDNVAASKKFHQGQLSLPFLKYADSVVWIRFVLRNKTSQAYIPISIGNAIIDQFDLYYINSLGRQLHLSSNNLPSQKNIRQSVKIINLPILTDSVRAIYLRIKSSDSMAIPITVQSAGVFRNAAMTENLRLGIFIGIILVMMLYNLMLFVVVRDNSYLYYVIYIILLGLTQWQIRGFDDFFSIDKSVLNNFLVPVTRILFWYSVLLFVNEFLQLKRNMRRKYRRYYNLLYVLNTLPVVFILSGKITVGYSLTTFSAFVNVLALLAIGAYLYVKGFKPAKFFMLGWTLFLITVLATIARNKGLLPYNNFTANFILYSSAFELVMFSVALADRINFYRKQNNEAQAHALAIAKENERLITGQNIALENRVKERTQELIESNQHLSVTVENLKSAQIQLIETEKMASLGQLTAGIAHEINNPINFVSANIKPLQMDLAELFALLDYYHELEKDPHDATALQKVAAYREKIDVNFIKSEIQTLLAGIDEGAARTVEIVQSLRAFSRTDEPVLKLADINRAILTTLVILRSTIPYYIEIKPVLNKLPLLNCYPGKINQVLVNLINNSIQAIKAKKAHENEYILITTTDYPENITIEITDSGIGMTEGVKQHIFDPFYTTKDIGEGTGLGLSIVFGIIEKHSGFIEVSSQPGKGSTFKVMLPKTLQ